jgi:hypothetical protein
MNSWPLVSNARWPPPRIGDEYRNGASDLPIEIRNSASSVAPNGSRANHHSTGSSPVTRILASGKHLAASGRGAASYKTTRNPALPGAAVMGRWLAPQRLPVLSGVGRVTSSAPSHLARVPPYDRATADRSEISQITKAMRALHRMALVGTAEGGSVPSPRG